MARNFKAQLQREQLHRAAEEGDLERVEKLLRSKYPVNRFDFIGKTPLHYAVESGQMKIVDRLLRAGADVDAHDDRLIGNTPLSDNIRKCSYEMAHRLIEAGADPTLRGWMQRSAIDRAEERTDAEAAKIQQLLRETAKRRRLARIR